VAKLNNADNNNNNRVVADAVALNAADNNVAKLNNVVNNAVALNAVVNNALKY
jgi:hypothetical protein